MTYQIYIDANTGTYGGADNLYLVEVEQDDVEYLMEGTDDDINQFGVDNGQPAISVYAAASWINKHISPAAREEFLSQFDPEPDDRRVPGTVPLAD